MQGYEANLATADREIATLAELAAGDLGAPVPTCPGWTMADLVDHLGTGFWWFRAWAAQDDVTARVRFRERPVRPEGTTPPQWLALQAAETMAWFAQADPARPAPAFVGPRTVGWWAQRVALELAVHRTDAQAARGLPIDPLPAADAVAGIAETLADYIPLLFPLTATELRGTVHLHCTDTEGEWLIRLAPAGDSGRTVAEVTSEHAKGDVAARGAANDLYLTLWGRPARDRLEVFGDRALLDDFVALLTV